MFVRDEDGGQIFRRATDGGKALTDLTRRKAIIHEHAAIFRFHVGTIAGGTAAQDGEFYGHSLKLVPRQPAGKCFWWRRNLIFIPTGTILWPGTIRNRLVKLPDRETKP